MRNVSIWRRKSSAEWCWTSSSLLSILSILSIFVLCCQMTAAENGYTIPADAIRIGAEELAADHLTDHLAGLIGNDSQSNIGIDSFGHENQRANQIDSSDEDEEDGQQEELEKRVEADDHQLPTALVRLNALLRAAEERKERLESNAATSRLLSINRGGFFRGCKFNSKYLSFVDFLHLK